MTATPGEGAYGNAAGVTTPTAHKMAQTTEFVKTTTANVIRPGILYNGASSLVTGKANMSVDVAAFSIVTQRSATAGVMKWSNDATLNIATDVTGAALVAPGSNSRYFLVFAWHREYALDGTDSNPVIGVLQGTAAASPTVPSLASYPGAVELARILVPSGVTATNSGTTFTHTAPFTSVDGGKVPFRTTTEMNAWTTALTDQRALDLSSGITYRWNGSAWKAWESDWITYTPTLVGITVGTGGGAGAVGAYMYTNGRIVDRWSIKLGTSGASVSSAPTKSLPVNMVAPIHAYREMGGEVSYYDLSATLPYTGRMFADDTNQTRIRLATSALSSITSAAPFTWAAGDAMQGETIYDPA